jgi:hypothetical protein
MYYVADTLITVIIVLPKMGRIEMNVPAIHVETDAFQGGEMSCNAAIGTACTGLDFTHLRGGTVKSSQKAAARCRLRGKTLALFDMLADGGAVEIETLFEGLSGDDSAGAREMRERVDRYAAKLKLALEPHGWSVGQDGAARYLIERAALSVRDTEAVERLRGLLVGGTVPTALRDDPRVTRARQ